MRGWYDIYGLELNAGEDLAGITQANQDITTMIEQEIAAGVSAKRIILAGFSQGGAVALYTGLRFNVTIGGIIALSAYMPLAHTLNSERHQANQATPIFLAHGVFDPVVPFSLGLLCHQQMRELNYSVSWNSYPMQHAVVPAEIQHIGKFIREIL